MQGHIQGTLGEVWEGFRVIWQDRDEGGLVSKGRKIWGMEQERVWGAKQRPGA